MADLRCCIYLIGRFSQFLRCEFALCLVFGHRMPQFGRDICEKCWSANVVCFCMINAINSIDKHSFLREFDCEIY